MKNLNYTARNAPEYSGYLAQIDELVRTLDSVLATIERAGGVES